MTATGSDLFLGIDHVGIAVPDLDAALEMYASAFGMAAEHVETNDEQGVREAMLRVGKDGDDWLQLLAPTGPDSPIAGFIDKRGPGIQQLAMTVADCAAASAELRRRGLRLLYDEPRPGTAGSKVNFVHPQSTGGILLELVEPAGDAQRH